MKTIHKALLLPYNEKFEIMIQDRAGHKPPPWGFFGGSVEKGETNMEAVIRETREELSLEVSEGELEHLGEFRGVKDDGTKIVFNVYLWEFNRALEDIDIKEGAGFEFMTVLKARELMMLELDRQVLDAFEVKFKPQD